MVSRGVTSIEAEEVVASSLFVAGSQAAAAGLASGGGRAVRALTIDTPLALSEAQVRAFTQARSVDVDVRSIT